MPHFSTTRRVNLSAEQAYAIAADVGSYDEFLPLLRRSTIRGERTIIGEVESFKADLTVGFDKLKVQESFTSLVSADHLNRCVTATSHDGPMKALKAVWKIVPQSDGKAEVSITVDYTLKSMMLQMMASGLMDFAAHKIMQAFEERGIKLYGALTS
jgi:coenzyme Q-binding protein COQ10